MKQGVVKWWKANKGYGFIVPDGGGDDVFVHHMQLPENPGGNGHKNLRDGERVSYEDEVGVKGRRVTKIVRHDQVRPAGPPATTRASSPLTSDSRRG